MNWLSNIRPPKLKAIFGNKSTPENLWIKCKGCGEMIFHRDVESSQHVCPQCFHHMRVGPQQRFSYMFDDDDYELLKFPTVAQDPLKFRDEKKYSDRLKDARHKTHTDDAVETAVGTMSGMETVICVQNFEFMGGSLGMGAGEAIIRSMEEALARKAPFIFFVASGGARMQEGILSLMQMPRTTIAVQMLREAHLPYVVVLTNPTTGGVAASYAMLGDVHIAEPDALIGFAGARVIEQTIREKLPEGFQKAEYLLDHGMVDMVVHRHDLRETISTLVGVLMKRPLNGAVEEPAATPSDLPQLTDETTPDDTGAGGTGAPSEEPIIETPPPAASAASAASAPPKPGDGTGSGPGDKA